LAQPICQGPEPLLECLRLRSPRAAFGPHPRARHDDVGNNDNGFLVWLNDEAGSDIGTVPDDPSDSPVAGTFRPESPHSLSTFDGVDASRTWTLSVTDDTTADTGTLQQWSLKISY
jgi:hypothetical protein